MNTIKLKDIVAAPWNTRGEITEASVATLAQTMKENGLSTPITLGTIKATGKTYLIAGHRRVAAARSLGWKEIPFSLVEYATDEDATLATINDNDQRLEADLIGSARSIAALLDLGYDAEKIARKMSRSVTWVNRRRKLIALGAEWAKAADRFTHEQLEKIAAFPPEVQAKVAKECRPDTATWSWVESALAKTSRDLDSADFDTGDCRACLKRTGVEADLFGVADGNLGKCLDCKCFEKRVKAREDALIAEPTKGADEVVRVKYSWELPRESESSPKRTKKYPCAYVSTCNGIEVRWGESKKAKEAREKAAKEAREAENAEAEATRKRIGEIREKLTEAFSDDGDEWPDALIGALGKFVTKNATNEQTEWILDTLAAGICGWKSDEEWARLVRDFDFVADVLTEDERAFLIEACPPDGEEDDE